MATTMASACEAVIAPGSPFSGASTTTCTTPTVSAWHFPGATAAAAAAAVHGPAASLSAAVLSKNHRFLASSSPASKGSEFLGCGYNYSKQHPSSMVAAGGFQYSSAPLPYCSPSCKDCPTSTRLLLVLHSLRLGLGTDGGWTRMDVCEPIMPLERSRWGRRSQGSKSRRRTRASAVSSEQIARTSSASEPMTAPFNVLITGSTKGIGYALAKEFLRHGDNVIICSRSEERVGSALKELRKEFGEQRVVGTTCDVRNGNSVQALADFAKSQVGYVDIWINNAGTNAYTYKTLVDTNDAAIEEIVTTNTLGVMLCCRQAIRAMVDQPRGGHIFNMDGAGADGNATPRFAAYGATKRSLSQFTKSLQAELKQQSIKNVLVHNLSPGMVTTDLLMSGTDTRQAKFFINVLAEPAEKVASYLVPRIRAIPGDKNKSSKYIRFLTGFKAYSQIISRLIFKARKDRFVPED